MKLYDRNGDGTLDAKELSASPPLLELLKNLKARSPDHPDSLTADDISGRLDEWIKSPTILMPGMVMVSLDDKRLDGATVTLEPEPFLGSSYHSHQGETNAAGMANLDPELKDYPLGIYVGLYRVRISKIVDGKEIIPCATTPKANLAVKSSTTSASVESSYSN